MDYELRIEAHTTAGRKPSYPDLHDAMRRAGASRVYVGQDGVQRELPGMYEINSSLSGVDEVYRKVQLALDALPFRCTFEVFEKGASRWGETKPLPTLGTSYSEIANAIYGTPAEHKVKLRDLYDTIGGYKLR